MGVPISRKLQHEDQATSTHLSVWVLPGVAGKEGVPKHVFLAGRSLMAKLNLSFTSVIQGLLKIPGQVDEPLN